MTATKELQAKPFTPYGACWQVWNSQAFEILIAGPAGTGKTRSDLEKLLAAAMMYPVCRCLIIRNTRAELTETALAELEDHVFPEDWRKWGGKAKRQQRQAYNLPNGSIIVVGGMDDPLKILSSEYDRILVVEAVQLNEVSYELLTSRCRATNTPYNQIICETNPNVPTHWLLKRAKAGKMELYTSTHRDNPKYVDQKTGQLTKAGKFYIEVVLGNLTGNQRRRLLDGVWCADEAAVFDNDVLERHQQLCRPPNYCLRFTHKLDGKARDMSIRARRHEDVICKRQSLPVNALEAQNRLLWWGELELDEGGFFRAPQQYVYVLSADISGGNGASNSVIGILNRNTRQKVGEWVSATISPGGLARVLAMLGLWCGGSRQVGHLIWEANYPGPYFGRQLSQVLQYPSLHRRELGVEESFSTASQKLGWWNSRPNLRDGIEALRDAYAGDEFHNPSEASIQEAFNWVRYPNGSIGPAHLQDESPDAKATHGDRVIADMLLVMGLAIDLPTPKRDKAKHWAAELTEEPGDELEEDESIAY